MKTSIALIGFMGTGKTVVGEALSKKLARKFVKLDSLIEQRVGKSIADIFEQDGEEVFRELEIEITKEVAKDKNLVVDCGGGVVLNQINIDRLRKEARIVYLTASPMVTLNRVSDDGGRRPLLKGANKASNIQELLGLREPFYQRAADIEINTSKLDINSVAEQIINELEKDEGFNF